MKQFNRNLIDQVRRMFYAVYMDEETPAEFIGHTEGYTADRVRIYQTGWEYENPETARTDEELQNIITEYAEEWPYQLLIE